MHIVRHGRVICHLMHILYNMTWHHALYTHLFLMHDHDKHVALYHCKVWQVHICVLFENCSADLNFQSNVSDVDVPQAKALGVEAAQISSASEYGDGILSDDQRYQVASAASDVFGASAQSLQQASGQLALT